MMAAKIGLYLMGLKGLDTLRAYCEHLDSTSLAFVVSARDAAVEADYYDDIQDLCKRNGVLFYERKEASNLAAAYRFALGWRWLIPDTEGLIILHDSLLPRYRGFAPLVNALINGEKQIGVTALFAAATYDTGPIIAQRSIEVEYPIKVATAIEAITPLYADLMVSLVSQIVSGETLEAVEQDEAKATYSLWRDEDDYRIDWSHAAETIRRSIDALGFPYRGASTWIGDRLGRVLEAEEINDCVIENRDAGKVLFVQGGCPVVVCGTGLLKLTKVVDDASGKDMLPLKRFRTRFT